MKLTILILAASCLRAHSLPKNFAWVDSGNRISRGGQPTMADMIWLRDRGVTNVIKLNIGKEPLPRGMRLIAIPISFCEQLCGGKSLARKLNTATVNIQPGTYVHCTHGANRTGSAIITYRVKALLWSKARAKTEALRYGWGNSLPGLKCYVKHLL